MGGGEAEAGREGGAAMIAIPETSGARVCGAHGTGGAAYGAQRAIRANGIVA